MNVRHEMHTLMVKYSKLKKSCTLKRILYELHLTTLDGHYPLLNTSVINVTVILIYFKCLNHFYCS